MATDNDSNPPTTDPKPKKPKFRDELSETRSVKAALQKLDADEKAELAGYPDSIRERFAARRLTLLKGVKFPETYDLLLASKAITQEQLAFLRSGAKDSETPDENVPPAGEQH